MWTNTYPPLTINTLLQIEFLLEILIDLKAKDWFNYLEAVYDKNLQLIKEKIRPFNTKMFLAIPNRGSINYLMCTMTLERRSKSCIHANILLYFKN